MSSEKDLVSNTGRFGIQRVPRRQSRSPCDPLWRQRSSKRSVSRSRTPCKIAKKIQKLNKSNPHTRKMLARQKKTQIKRPSAPHNTNQFLIDANNVCEESTTIYPEHDRFTYDFQNHSMAGSMMDFMARFSQLHGQSTEASNNSDKGTSLLSDIVGEAQIELGNENFEAIQGVQNSPSLFSNQETCQEDRVSDLVNSTSKLGTDNPVNIAVRDEEECNPYSHYLRQGETGENLQELVQHLVTVINKKNVEIQSLKSQLSL